LANKFDNDRDAGRILTAVPFHIRRPNKQLVQEYEKLLNFGGADRFLKMAIPLAFSHLVKVTCMRAGNVGSDEQKECFQSFASKYVSDFWNKYKSADNRDDKYLAMEALQNIKFGGQSMKLKDMIYGKTNDEPEFRSAAIWAAGWEGAMMKGNDYFFPVFANQKDDHEVRISALAMIFYSNPSTTDMARILAVLKTEKDYEVINMAYAMFEQWANSINPCNHEVKEKASFFLKYMKQYSQFEPKWGFGYSKTYVREYQQQKYGYGGSYNYYVVGSHKSTTPLSMGMGISNTFFHSYQANRFMVHLRVEGLAKGLIRKFKTMDPGTWKLDDLQNILSNEMGIRERPDQPVRVKITISVKGANVFSRAYDEKSAKEGGKLMEFFNSLSGMGDDYKINHQRLINVGSMLYEQPSEIGLPLAYISSMTASASIKATVKRGNNRGLIFRNVEYDINVLANAHDGMMFTNPARKVGYAIFQSRIYHMHAPRKIVVGVNIIKKELKLSVSRPAADNPAFNIMHAQTVVNVRGTKLGQPVPELKQHCSSCEDRVTVSRGPGAAKGRIVRDIDNEEFGYMNHAEYFDCEMDISKGNARGRAILAFMPYNKNPKTLGAVLSLGIRQIAAYIALYPRAEKCGIFTRWSQSPTNPTTDIELTLSVKSKENGARMFFRGRETTIKAILKANGVPKPRAYRAQVSIKSTPNRLQNAIKVQINRAMVKELGIKPYTICFDYESKYPDFAPEFLAVDLNQRLTVNGKASLKYGEGNSCGSGNGQIEVDFNHETTDEGSNDLKEKWYYKKCMEAKQSPEWKARSGNKLPATEPCYMTIWDATAARHYHWKVKFVKLTNRMKNIIGGIKTIVQAGLLPYYDEEPDESDSNGAIGPFLDLDVKIRNGDKSADIRMETSNGVRKYEGYQLKMEWTKRLRNMRMDRTIARLIDAGIIYPCVATVGSIQTNDNVTYPYNAGSCWTLTSGHCGPNPAYAVFTKKVGNKLAMKAYFGGHLLEVSESGSVSINGSPKTLKSGEEQTHRDGDTEIFKVVKWGSTINVYSFLKVWVATDNVFVQVMPAPSTRGQHCGLCGTFNRSPFDEWMSKDGVTMLTSADAMVNDWKWKC